MPKVLILVLSALRDPWGSMLQVQRETWDKVEHPDTQTLYYCGKFTGVPPNWTDTFFSPNHGEELEDIAGRTIEAFEHSLTLEWDFMARSHSSMYVHKRNLVDFIEQNEFGPNTFVGLTVEGTDPFVWGGGGYIFSRDVIEQFVANKDQFDLSLMEDRGMSKLATELEIPWNGCGRMASVNELQNGEYFVMGYNGDSFNSRDWHDLAKIGDQYYVRVKQDMRRERDLEIFRQLHRYLPA